MDFQQPLSFQPGRIGKNDRGKKFFSAIYIYMYKTIQFSRNVISILNLQYFNLTINSRDPLICQQDPLSKATTNEALVKFLPVTHSTSNDD